MKNNTLVSFCIFTSIGAILVGAAWTIAALAPEPSSQWGEVAAGCAAQAILIAGGLIALAICGSSNRD